MFFSVHFPPQMFTPHFDPLESYVLGQKRASKVHLAGSRNCGGGPRDLLASAAPGVEAGATSTNLGLRFARRSTRTIEFAAAVRLSNGFKVPAGGSGLIKEHTFRANSQSQCSLTVIVGRPPAGEWQFGSLKLCVLY